ncbi:MAG: hypothetical protein WCA63_05455 [Gallionella sp.]
MQRNLLGAIVIMAGIAGCATNPANVADHSPLNTTAVIEQHVVNNGIKGFLPFENSELHYVRANMRRDESTLKGTGTFTGFLIGTRSETNITRIDRKLKWSLNTEKSEYTECPLKGCLKPANHPAAKQNETKPPEAQHEAGCTMHIAHTSFTVKATGQKKSINGFDTDEYQVAWVVNLRDQAARNTTSTLNMDIWTTPMTRAMRDTLGVEESYDRAYSGAVADTGKRQILPADAAKLISAYLASSLKPSDLDSFLEAGKQMEKIKGYPISTHLAWGMEGNACAPKETADKSSSNSTPTSPGGLVSSLTGMFAKQKTEDTMKEAGAEPILSFTFEVKSLKIEPVHDSVFTVPRNYKLVPQP